VVATVAAYQGFEPYDIDWADSNEKWMPGLQRDGILVGVKWSGPAAQGYDLEPESVRTNVEYQIAT